VLDVRLSRKSCSLTSEVQEQIDRHDVLMPFVWTSSGLLTCKARDGGQNQNLALDSRLSVRVPPSLFRCSATQCLEVLADVLRRLYIPKKFGSYLFCSLFIFKPKKNKVLVPLSQRHGRLTAMIRKQEPCFAHLHSKEEDSCRMIMSFRWAKLLRSNALLLSNGILNSTRVVCLASSGQCLSNN
jgi:hypothetical protein